MAQSRVLIADLFFQNEIPFGSPARNGDTDTVSNYVVQPTTNGNSGGALFTYEIVSTHFDSSSSYYLCFFSRVFHTVKG